MSNDTSIDRLVREFQAGEHQHSFRQIFERYHRQVVGYFVKRGFALEDSRDLTQETMIGVYKGLEGLREVARFEPWLFQIAANVYRNRLRTSAAVKRGAPEIALDEDRERNLAAPTDDSASSAGDPLAGALRDERARLLHEALQELPPQMRRCVFLRLDQDLKYREIAAVMRLSVGAVKAQLHQARKRLKNQLAGHFEDWDALGPEMPAAERKPS